MKNKERPEVIDALIKVVDPHKNYWMTDFEKEMKFSGEFSNWMNSEYVEPFKITKAERCILESLEKDITFIKRNSMSHLQVLDDEFKSWEYFSVFDHLFKFIKDGREYEISDILNSCEVVEDETL